MQRRSVLKKLFAGVFGFFAAGTVTANTVDRRVEVKDVGGKKIYYAEMPVKEALEMLPGLAHKVYNRKLRWYSFTNNGDTARISWSADAKMQTGWYVSITYKYIDPSVCYDKIRDKTYTSTRICENEREADDFLNWHLPETHVKILNKNKFCIYE
jgi:hypothetical protein